MGGRGAKSGSKARSVKKTSQQQANKVTRDNGFTGVVSGSDLTGSDALPNSVTSSTPQAIQDAMDAQGFRGKPKVVTDQAEFDKAVAAAWNGNGLELTRGIGAPDQQTLDAYKNSMTDGEWYVSCNGGSVHGYGQYATYTYGGKASANMIQGAQRYADRNARHYDPSTGRYVDGKTHVFRMTLDPSAKIISESDLQQKMRDHNRQATPTAISNAKTLKATKPSGLLSQLSGGTRAEKAAAKAWSSKKFDAKPRKNTSAKYQSEYNSAMKRLQQATSGIKVPRRFADLGVFGAAKGYDFYYDRRTGYSVTLNRSKLIVFEG